MTRTLLAAAAFSISCALGQTVFTTDFNTTLPAEITAGTATLTPVEGFSVLGAPAAPFSGTFLRSPTANVVKLQLTGLPGHTSVSIGSMLRRGMSSRANLRESRAPRAAPM
ncbi:MAG: hypothetical protein EOP87_19525, partial [Verrucomicrobiaceae bacterium]